MAVIEYPVFIAHCDSCGAHGPWSGSVDEAFQFAQEAEWLVRRAKILSESRTLCPGCRPRNLEEGR
ncbi:hypothetical protein [Sorangium sp. So ce362]|uniref:hypothetical protein n=1 Tax=Sorangium sp. So ce362 TaxID=3133303 RepID=UPI003F5E57F2